MSSSLMNTQWQLWYVFLEVLRRHFCFVLELCPECREGLLCQQQRDLREYTQATIYVHKVVDNKKVPVPLVAITSNDQAYFFVWLAFGLPRDTFSWSCLA